MISLKYPCFCIRASAALFQLLLPSNSPLPCFSFTSLLTDYCLSSSCLIDLFMLFISPGFAISLLSTIQQEDRQKVVRESRSQIITLTFARMKMLLSEQKLGEVHMKVCYIRRLYELRNSDAISASKVKSNVLVCKPNKLLTVNSR